MQMASKREKGNVSSLEQSDPERHPKDWLTKRPSSCCINTPFLSLYVLCCRSVGTSLQQQETVISGTE